MPHPAEKHFRPANGGEKNKKGSGLIYRVQDGLYLADSNSREWGGQFWRGRCPDHRLLSDTPDSVCVCRNLSGVNVQVLADEGAVSSIA